MRFKDYSDCWQCKSFVAAFDVLTNNTLSRAELNYENGVYKNIHYGDVLIKFPAHIDVENQNVPFINDDSSSAKFDDALLKDGDIVIADTAEDYTVGKATEIENSAMRKVVSGLHTIPCRPKIKFAARYLGYYINSPAYHNQLIPYIQGVKVSSVSKSLINKTSISFPSCNEQQKIAEFLSLIDDRIETQNKIIKRKKSLIISFVIEFLLAVLSLVESILSLNIFSLINNLLKLLWTIFKEVKRLWSKKKT
ncbi:MAG: restriction endonuclease subunit S [Lachnospiraceae bacterium]|nr:restriction endonuclease subunit S [Lachnospiraceae bacterium]